MSKQKNRFAVGVSDEGDILKVVKVRRTEMGIQVLVAKNFRLRTGLDISDFDKKKTTQAFDDQSNIDIASFNEEEELNIKTDDHLDEEKLDADNAVFIEILELAKEKQNRIALSVSEPKIFYNVFDTDWGLRGSRLIKKIISELKDLKEDTLKIDKDSLGIIRLTKGRIMTISRDQALEFFTRIDLVKQFIGRRIPRIEFVESSELSLINLVLNQYKPADKDITLILYVGDDSSRFFFLKGTQIHHISQPISEGINSPKVVTKVYSRFLLALDTLGLPKLDKIILIGLPDTDEIKESFLDNFSFGVKEYFQDNFNSDIEIELFQHELDLTELAPDQREKLGSFSISLGAAIRAVSRDNKRLLDIDLNPLFIKEGQKRISIAKFGWLLLLMIPWIIGYTIVNTENSTRKIRILETETITKQAYLSEQREFEVLIEEANAILVNLDNSITVLDSLLVKTETWSDFIGRIMKLCENINGIWLTEISAGTDHQAFLKGYSYYRNRIPKFVKKLGSSTLKKVEVREIRESTVYYFEIETDVSKILDKK